MTPKQQRQAEQQPVRNLSRQTQPPFPQPPKKETSVSSEHVPDGMNNVPEQPDTTLIGADLRQQPEPSEPKSETLGCSVLSKEQRNLLPRFSIRGAGCCGLMEVSGIEGYYRHSPHDIVLGLIMSLNRHREGFLQVKAKAQAFAVKAEKGEIHNAEYLQAYHEQIHHTQFWKIAPAGQYIFTYRPAIEGINTAFKNFAKFIAHNNLGELTFAEPFYNPNSGNVVQTVLWSINNEEHTKYWNKFLGKDFFGVIE